MTGVRASGVFKPEKVFGQEDTSARWNRLPSGLSLDYNPKNGMKTYYEIGSKFVDRSVASQFSGTFSLKFKLDYNCLGILGAVFEGYSYNGYTHRFFKQNGKRIPSFSLRVKVLNRIVGGSKDTTVVLTGCVANNVSFNHSGSGDATIGVTISGNYAWEQMDTSDLSSTDWDEYYDEDGETYDGEEIMPVEWFCVHIGDEPVAYTKNVTFGVSNSADMVPGCGSRRVQNYREGQSNITISTSCYSSKPEVYYQRMYSGGANNTLLEPKAKGLAPIPRMGIRSSLDSDYSMVINLYKVYVDSVGQRSYTPNGELVDSPSLQVTNFDIEITNRTGPITIWS